MSQPKFIDIRHLVSSKSPKLAKWIPGFIYRYLERVLHQQEINDFMKVHHDKKNAEFCQEIMDYFNITTEVINQERIPAKGKTILVMNHPLGGMDAVALVAKIGNYRPDMKFIVNDLLMSLENMKGLFVGVNKHGSNAKSKRLEIKELFESDQAVCIFPAGMVSRHYDGKIQDYPWKKTFVTYAREHDHTIVPIFIDGKLRPFFYRLSKIRQFLRIKANLEMFYLSDELFRQRDKTLRFTVGEPFHLSTLDLSKSDADLAQEIRSMVYAIPQQKKS